MIDGTTSSAQGETDSITLISCRIIGLHELNVPGGEAAGLLLLRLITSPVQSKT